MMGAMPYRAATTGVSVMVPHFRRRRERYLLTNGRHACSDHLSAVSCHSRRHSLATAATMDGRAAMVDVTAAAERATVGRSCCTATEADTAIIADVVEREVTAIKDIGEHSNIVRMLIHGHDANYNCGYIVYERMTCDLFSALRQRGAMPLSR